MDIKQPVSKKDICLIERLKAHPKLHQRVESLLGFVGGDNILLADDAEEAVIKELRIMGGELLEEWAQDQAKKQVEATLATRSDLKKASKKNSIGTLPMEKLK